MKQLPKLLLSTSDPLKTKNKNSETFQKLKYTYFELLLTDSSSNTSDVVVVVL